MSSSAAPSCGSWTRSTPSRPTCSARCSPTAGTKWSRPSSRRWTRRDRSFRCRYNGKPCEAVLRRVLSSDDIGDQFVAAPALGLAGADAEDYVEADEGVTPEGYAIELKPDDDISAFYDGAVVLVDYYVEQKSNAQQIDITPDKFGGNYYLEASTLFRDTNGVDMPAEFIIPNCKIQSNFTFTMASTGDPSTFTFTMDAFPDYTRFNHKKKVLAAIQIIKEAGSQELARTSTAHAKADELLFG